MSAIAYITNQEMIEFHRLNGNKTINFWRLGNTKKISFFKKGDLLFFLSKGTEKGKEKALEVRKVCAFVDKIAWQDIPPEEQKQFLKTFQKILLNLESLEATI